MRRGLFIGSVIVLLLAVGAATVLAAGPGYRHGPRPGRMGWIQNLNLTPEQEQKLLSIRQAYVRETLPLRQELEQKRFELRQLWAADKPDETAIVNKLKEMIPSQVKLKLKARAMREEMKKVLTPEQLKKLEQGHKRWGMPGAGKDRPCGWRLDGNGPND